MYERYESQLYKVLAAEPRQATADLSDGVQATFLKPANQAVPENAALKAELDALGQDDLELRCRRSGMSRAGGR